jgi:hypothetical protein
MLKNISQTANEILWLKMRGFNSVKKGERDKNSTDNLKFLKSPSGLQTGHLEKQIFI